MVKLPLDKVDIHLTPGTTATFRVQVRRLADLSLHIDGEVNVKGPQTVPAAKVSEALTQTVEPISILEEMRFEDELAEDIETALSQKHVTNALFENWLGTDPGVFNEWTAIRDMFKWTNRQAWDRLFGGEIPIYLPPGMRGAKNEIWKGLDAAERGRRLRIWRVEVEKNKAYYAAARAVIQDVIVQFLHRSNGKFILEVMEKDDPLRPSVEDEPWLSSKTHWYRVLPIDMDIPAARVHAQKRAAERGLEAQKRSIDEDPAHPRFDDQPTGEA